MYKKLVDPMGEGNADGIHTASYVAIEYMARAGFLLIAFWAFKFISPYAAAFAFLAVAYAVKGRTLAPLVLAENNDSFDTLLFYLIVSLAAIFIVLGVGA